MYVLSIYVNIHMKIDMIMKNTYLNAYIITHTNISICLLWVWLISCSRIKRNQTCWLFFRNGLNCQVHEIPRHQSQCRHLQRRLAFIRKGATMAAGSAMFGTDGLGVLGSQCHQLHRTPQLHCGFRSHGQPRGKPGASLVVSHGSAGSDDLGRSFTQHPDLQCRAGVV